MAVRKIYVNPGDLIVVRVLADPEIPKNEREWQYQLRPYSTSFTVGVRDLTFNDPGQDLYLQQGAEIRRKIL